MYNTGQCLSIASGPADTKHDPLSTMRGKFYCNKAVVNKSRKTSLICIGLSSR